MSNRRAQAIYAYGNGCFASSAESQWPAPSQPSQRGQHSMTGDFTEQRQLSKEYEENIRIASNEVYSVIGVVEPKEPKEPESSKLSPSKLPESMALKVVNHLIHSGFVFEFTAFWIESLRTQLLVLPVQHDSFISLVHSDYRQRGLINFFTTNTTYFLTHRFIAFVFHSDLSVPVLYMLRRIIWANYADPGTRERLEVMAKHISKGISYLGFACAFPLAMYVTLQQSRIMPQPSQLAIADWKLLIPTTSVALSPYVIECFLIHKTSVQQIFGRKIYEWICEPFHRRAKYLAMRAIEEETDEEDESNSTYDNESNQLPNGDNQTYSRVSDELELRSSTTSGPLFQPDQLSQFTLTWLGCTSRMISQIIFSPLDTFLSRHICHHYVTLGPPIRPNIPPLLPIAWTPWHGQRQIGIWTSQIGITYFLEFFNVFLSQFIPRQLHEVHSK